MKWLTWASELQSIAQIGLTYSKDRFDRERFTRIRELSVEILSEYTNIEQKKVFDLFANEQGYQTPKIDIRAAIFQQDNILMVKEVSDGKWALPGGWADIGLSIVDNVIKESKEEAGARVTPKRIIAILDRNRHIHDHFPYAAYKIFVECDYIESKWEVNLETIEASFFSLSNLPPLSEGRNTKQQIALCFRARNLTYFETVFD